MQMCLMPYTLMSEGRLGKAPKTGMSGTRMAHLHWLAAAQGSGFGRLFFWGVEGPGTWSRRRSAPPCDLEPSLTSDAL